MCRDAYPWFIAQKALKEPMLFDYFVPLFKPNEKYIDIRDICLSRDESIL